MLKVDLNSGLLKLLCEKIYMKNVPEKKMIRATTIQKLAVEYRKRLSGVFIFSNR
jgi:hypothetical protein